MKETDNDDQRRAWVLKLRLSAQGVQAFETRAVNIDLQGIPTPDPTRATPCWRRGEAGTRRCTPTD